MSSWLQRAVNETGRWGNWAYDHTFGGLGGWAGKQLGNDDPQHSTALGNYTRHLFNMSAGGAIPFGGPLTGYAADYAAQRQLGNTRGRAAGIAGTNLGISAASIAAGAGAGAYLNGGAGAAEGGATTGFGGFVPATEGGATSGLGGFVPATGGESSTLFGSMYGGSTAPATFGGTGGGALQGASSMGGGGMDWGNLIKQGMNGYQKGSQQGGGGGSPANDTALLAWLLSQQKNNDQPQPNMPLWTRLGQ